jgi:hypothetical protein
VVTESTCKDAGSGKLVKVIYDDGSGKVSALDDGETLRLKNWLAVFPGSSAPQWITYRYDNYDPSQRLPACDSAQVVKVLARITRKSLNSVFAAKKLGENSSKTFCSAQLAFRGWTNFTIEWMDQAKGRYWVQFI